METVEKIVTSTSNSDIANNMLNNSYSSYFKGGNLFKGEFSEKLKSPNVKYALIGLGVCILIFVIYKIIQNRPSIY